MVEAGSVSATMVTVLVTIAVYQGAVKLQQKIALPLFNPVLVAVVLLMLLLVASGFPYAAYARETRGLSFMLGPATVALAVPLYRQRDTLRRHWPAIVTGSLLGAVSGIGSVLLLAPLFDVPAAVMLSLVPKSVTTPIAIGVSSIIGGLPPLTAALVILTGILGAVAGPRLLTLLRVKDRTAWGLAIGAAAHGIGTARAIQEGERQGAMSGLAIGLVGLATAVLAPLLVNLADL